MKDVWATFLHYYMSGASGIKIFFLVSLAVVYLFSRSPYGVSLINFLKTKNRKWIVATVIFCGAVLHLLWLLWTPYSPGAANTEDVIMLNRARSVAEGRGFINELGQSSAVRPVGTAVVLSLFVRPDGSVNLMHLGFLHILLAMIALGLIYWIGNMLGGPLVGMMALFFSAFYPTYIYSTKIVLDEHFFIPLFLGGIAFLISDYKDPKIWKLITAAILTGISAYFRPFSAVMSATVFIVWWLGRHEFRRALGRAVIFQCILLLLALPWAIRNQLRLGQPIFYTSVMGFMLYCGNNENPNQVNNSLENGGDRAFLLAKNEVEQNKAGIRAAKRWIVANPQAFLSRVGWRVLYFLGLRRESWILDDNFHTLAKSREPPPEKLKRMFAKIECEYYVFVFLWSLVGSLFGLLDRRGSGRIVLWIIVSIFSYLAIIGLTLSYRKYRFVIEPLFCLLAAYGIKSVANLRLPRWLRISGKNASLHAA